MKVICLLLLLLLCTGCRENEKVNDIIRLTSHEKEKADELIKQEQLLLKALPPASSRQKKQLLLRLGTIYLEQDKHKITDAAEKGLARFQELEENYNLSRKERWAVKRGQAVLLNRYGNQEQYLPLWFELLKEHRDANIPGLIVEDLCAVANHYEQSGDKNESLSIYKEAYQIAKKEDFPALQQKCLTLIINLSYDIGQYTEVLNHCRQVGIDSVALLMPSAYSILAKCHLKLHRPDSARYYLNKMFQIKKGTGNEIYCRLAETYMAENREDSAKFYLDKAMSLFQERMANYPPKDNHIRFPGYFLPAYSSFGTLLQANGKPQEAEKMFALVEPLMKTPIKTPSQKVMQIEALTRYSSFCKATRQYEKALELLACRDSIRQVYDHLQEERNSKNLFSQLQTNDLKHTIERKKLLVNNQNLLLKVGGISLMIILFLLGLMIWAYIKVRKLATTLQKKELQIKALETKQQEEEKSPLFKAFHSLIVGQQLFRQPKLTMKEVVKILHTNRNELSTCINQCSGKSFPQYLMEHRMKYFIEHFDSMDNIEKQIHEAGFSSSSNFYKVFGATYQMPPNQYLKQKKRELIIESSLS